MNTLSQILHYGRVCVLVVFVLSVFGHILLGAMCVKQGHIP